MFSTIWSIYIEIFDPALIPALIGTLHLSLQGRRNDRSKVALIAVTIRNQDTLNQFLDLAQSDFLASWDFSRALTDLHTEKQLKIVEMGEQPEQTTFLEVVERNNPRNKVNIFKITL